MRRIVFTLLLIPLFLSGAVPPGQRDNSLFKQIYSKTVGGRGQTFMVSTGPDINPRLLDLQNATTMAAMKNADSGGRAERFFEVRAELVTPGEPNVLLATFLWCEGGDPRTKGFLVLDCLQASTGFVVGIAAGTELELWNVGTGGSWPQTADLSGWSEIQLLRPVLDNRPAMKIEQVSDAIQVTVTEGATSAVTHYKQCGDHVFEFIRTDGPTIPNPGGK